MHVLEFTPLYSPIAPTLVLALLPLAVVGIVWTIAIKGYALWHAARRGQKKWFIAILIVNSLGILELVYLLRFRSSPSYSSAVSSSGEIL